MEQTLLQIVEFLREGPTSVPEHIWQDIENVIQITCVPVVKVGSERPCEASDFEKYLPDIESRLKNLVIVFSEIEKKFSVENRLLSKQQAVNVLLLCGEHACQEKWTTKKTLQSSEELLQILCRFWHCNSLLQLLNGTEYDALFLPALLALRPKLLKNTWKTYPAAVSCYQWLLFHVKSPHLGQHLATVVPTALILADDFVPENRVLGIKCLHHITDNVTRSELGWHGHGEVIYKPLERFLYERDASIIEPLVSCLVVVLEKVDRGYINYNSNYEWSRYDEVLDVFLGHMEMEDKLPVRLAYAKSFPSLVEAASLRMCRWSNRFMRVCDRYLEVAGYSERREAPHILQAIQTFSRHCWPIVPHHAPAMLHMLLKLLYNLTEAHDTDMCPQIEECVCLVMTIAPERSHIACADIMTHANFTPEFFAVLYRLFAAM